MKRLEGKTALVSGAASGIGRASAILFAQEGANVVALDRAPAVEETVAAIRKAGGNALALVKDSSEETNVAAAIDTLPISCNRPANPACETCFSGKPN